MSIRLLVPKGTATHRRVAGERRRLAPRLAILGLDPDVAARAHQRLHAVRLVVVAGVLESGGAGPLAHGVRGRASTQQQLQHLQRAGRRRLDQRAAWMSRLSLPVDR